MGVGIFWISLNRADLGCWRLTLNLSSFHHDNGAEFDALLACLKSRVPNFPIK